MEQDEEVVTEEPQLRYWNPWHRGRTVFTTSATPLANPVNSLQFVKMEPQPSVYCDTNPCVHPSSVYDSLQSFNQELQFQIEYQNNRDTQNLHQAQTSNECTIAGLSTLTPLDTVPLHNQSSFLFMRQEEDTKKFIKQEPDEELEELKPFQEVRDDIVTFNSIDEALDSIDPPSTPDSNRSSTSINSLQGNGNKMVLSNEKHEEVVKAAKSLFSKRTRTLYHWLFPDTSKNKLKATVSAAWDTLSEGEKHFYISQVLGRFGLQASSLMVNPQLGGMKYIPNEVEKSERKKNGTVEDQQAVDSLFDSCEDAGNWASYSEPKPIVNKAKPERKQRKKRQKGQKYQDAGPSDLDIEQEMKSLKKLKKVHKGLQEFEEDPELTKELEKFRLITEAAEEDIWGDIPDPEELFAEIAF